MSVPERLVTIQQASDELGISVASLHGTQTSKYSRFRRKVEGSHVLMFDVANFAYMERLHELLTEETKLFIEYLVHIEGLSYADQARIAKVTFQPLYTLKIGYEFALKFMRMFATHRPFHLARFDEYYGWKHKVRKSTKLYKGKV